MNKKAIVQAYGFAFPADLDRFYRIAGKHGDALFEAGVRLVGPFASKLSKDLDRWESDPPELFTVCEGDSDGLHWGYVFHEPGKPGYVASFYSREGYPISPAGPTIGAAISSHVEAVRRDKEDELSKIRAVGEDDRELAREIAHMRKLEDALRKEKRRFTPPKEPVATLDGLGVRAPKSSFAPIDSKKLAKELRDAKKLERWIDRGHELAREGKAGSALRIARDALAILQPEKQDRAILLAIAAYEALGRPLLSRTFAPRKPRKPKIDNRASDSMQEAELDPKGVQHLMLERWGAQPKAPDLDAISRFTNLESLTLRGYKLGDLPKSFAALKKLRQVELFECGLRAIPKVLGTLPLLDDLNIMQSLSVRSPKKPLRVPVGLELRKLRNLQLVACGLREVPAFVLRAKRLRVLDLAGNRFRTLPDGIAALTELGYLRLAENALASLPASMRKLRKLTFLSIEDNRFDAVPEVFAEMRLRDLSIGKNPLVKDKAQRALAKKFARKVYFT